MTLQFALIWLAICLIAYLVIRVIRPGYGQVIPDLSLAFLWLTKNTAPADLLLAWWDYGLPIRDFAKRKSFIVGPPENLLNTVSNKEKIKIFEPLEKVRDVANFFITPHGEEALKIMKRINAVYVLATTKDLEKIHSMYLSLNIPQEQWVIKETVLYKLISNEVIPGFQQVYRNNSVVIYKALI